MFKPAFQSHFAPFDYKKYENYSLGNYIKKYLQEHNTSLITDASLDVTITYEELDRLSEVISKAIKDLGGLPHDVLHIFAENSILWLAAYIAGQYQGLVVSASHASSPISDIKRNLNATTSSLLITTQDKWKDIQNEISTDHVLCVLVYTEIINSHGRYDLQLEETLQREISHHNDEELLDVCQMLMTSGSTGVPKVVLLQPQYCFGVIETVLHSSASPMKKGEVVNAIQPFPHSGGINVNVLAFMAAGANLIIMRKFEESFYSTIKKYRVQHIVAFASIFTYLSTLDKMQEEDVSFVKSIITSGTLQGSEVFRSVRKIFGENVNLINMYGQTETTLLFVSSSKLGTNLSHGGFICPNGSYKLVNVADCELLQNPGEVCVKGTPMFKSYYNDEVKTKACFTKDGYFRTGDFGKAFENGELQLLSRVKEIIKCRGFTIFPAELENHLNRHDSVISSAVVGKSDIKDGEIPVAFVVVKNNVSPNELKSFIEEEVPEYKRLHHIKILKTMPINSNKKIDKIILKKQAETCF